MCPSALSPLWRVATVLYTAWSPSCSADWSPANADGQCRSGKGEHAADDGPCHRQQCAALDPSDCADGCAAGDDFVHSCISDRAGAGLVRHVERRPATVAVQQGTSPLSHPRRCHLDRRFCGRAAFRSGHRNICRSLQHRNAVRVRAGIRRCGHPSLQRPATSSRVPLSRGPTDSCFEHRLLCPADGRIAAAHLDSLLCVAGHWAANLLLLQPSSHGVQPQQCSVLDS